MGILDRFKQIIEMNINEFLDKAEDPEAKINQIIRDLEELLLDMRRQVASAMANKHLNDKKFELIEGQIKENLENAQIALKNNDESLARKLLEKKVKHTSRLAAQKELCAADLGLVSRLKSELSSLEEKAKEARSKRETLVTKMRVAKAHSKALDAQEQLSSKIHQASDIIQDFNGFSQVEEKIDRQMAMNQARSELLAEGAQDANSQVQELKIKTAVDEELKALKNQLKGN